MRLRLARFLLYDPYMDRRSFIALIGGAASWPLTARAQQKTVPVIGYLHFASSESFAYQVDAFRQGLAENGYVDGKTVVIETRWAEGHLERLPALAADLVAAKVDVIAALGPPAAKAAKNATSTIPIVFQVGVDPVAEGLVAGLARPGGNLTGLSILPGALSPKRLELLCDLVPSAKVIALLVNPNESTVWIADLKTAARAKSVELPIVNASNEAEIDTALAALAGQHIDALVEGDAVLFMARREQLVSLERRYRIPAIGRFREFAVAGGLISYGPDLIDGNRQLGVYAARILKGVKPGDLPVQQPTKFQLVINLKTAKALGLTVPQLMLAQADEVIE
jgi:putative tryptophan/tyrosine transport system substrate-binding protein